MHEDGISVLKQISARLKTSSAVVPSLLAALISMPLGAAGLAIAPQFAVVFSVVLLSPLFVMLSQIMFFTIVDRDRLHNEEHIERRMQLDHAQATIGDNRTGREVVIEGEAVRAIENVGEVE
jgi:hypothetical protein